MYNLACGMLIKIGFDARLLAEEDESDASADREGIASSQLPLHMVPLLPLLSLPAPLHMALLACHCL